MTRLGLGVALVVVAVAAPAYAQRAPAPVTVAVGESHRPTPASVAQPEGANFELVSMHERWKDVPAGKGLRLSVQIVDEITELGNLIGHGMNDLSDDAIGLQFDGRKRRAKLRLGTGEGEYLRFRLDSDWHFAQGKARIAARVSFGIGEHTWSIELPDMEMTATEYRGDRGVMISVPLYERKW